MHLPATARETLNVLWNNYLSLARELDLEMMPPDVISSAVVQQSPVRLFRIGAWVARQGFFVSAWALWEYYSRKLCESLRKTEKKSGAESTVDWVAKSLAANDISFSDREWFSSANCLRNLIAHCGARAFGEPRAEKLMERAIAAFPDLEKYQDGYVSIEHCHLAELKTKVDEFIQATAPHSSVP